MPQGNPKPGERYRHFKNKLYQIVTIAHHSETDEKLVVYQALYGEFGVCARPYDMFISEVDHVKYPEVTQKYRFAYVETDTEQPDWKKEQPEKEHIEKEYAVEAQRADTAAEQPSVSDMAMFVETEHNVEEEPVHIDPTDVRVEVESVRAEELSRQQDSLFKMLTEPKAEPERLILEPTKKADVVFRENLPKEDRIVIKIDKSEHREFEPVKEIPPIKMEQPKVAEPAKSGESDEEGQANPWLMKFLDAETFDEKYEVLGQMYREIDNKLIDDIAVCMDIVIPDGSLQERFLQLKQCLRTKQRYEGIRL